jgi:hypothetical protein
MDCREMLKTSGEADTGTTVGTAQRSEAFEESTRSNGAKNPYGSFPGAGIPMPAVNLTQVEL